jgi:hypothetical protein
MRSMSSMHLPLSFLKTLIQEDEEKPMINAPTVQKSAIRKKVIGFCIPSFDQRAGWIRVKKGEIGRKMTTEEAAREMREIKGHINQRKKKASSRSFSISFDPVPNALDKSSVARSSRLDGSESKDLMQQMLKQFSMWYAKQQSDGIFLIYISFFWATNSNMLLYRLPKCML